MEIHKDVTGQVTVVIANHFRHLSHGHVCDLTQWNGAAIGGDDWSSSDFFQCVEVLGRILHAQRDEGVIGLFDSDDVVSSNGVPHRRHGFVNRDAVLRHAFKVILHIDVIAFRYPFGNYRLGSGEPSEQSLDLL